MLEHVDYVNVARDFRSNTLRRLFGDETKAPMQYRRVLNDLIEKAVIYAREKSIEDGELLYEVLQPLGVFVHQFATSFLADDELASKASFWVHRANPISDVVSKKNIPKIDREGLQEAAQLYLEQPVRHQRVDRCLVDALVAAEVYSFADEMLNEPKSPLLPTASPLRRSHPLWAFVKGHLGNLVSACVIFAIALLPYKYGWIGDTGLAVVAVILLGLLAILFVCGLFHLPSFWREQNKAAERVRNLIQTMATVYCELNPNTLVSVRHFRDRASKAADDGVVWPSSLFVVLDDLESRTGKF